MLRATSLMALACATAVPIATGAPAPAPVAFPHEGRVEAFPLRGVADAAPLPDGGTVVVEEYGHRLLRVSTDGVIRTVAVALRRPTGVTVLPDGAIVVADAGAQRLVRIAPDGTVATLARLRSPGCVRAAADGSLVVTQEAQHRVRAVAPDGRLTLIAGTGVPGFSGDGGAARRARLASPTCAVPTADGRILIADHGNSRLREVGVDGRIRTVAGTGRFRFAGDGGPAARAGMDPADIAVAPDGALLVADGLTHRVRRIGHDGMIGTIAGTGAARHGGDGGPARLARLSLPMRIAVAADGSVLVTDIGAQAVRRITPDGLIATVAGSPQQAGRRPDEVMTRPAPGATLWFWQRGGLRSVLRPGRDAAGHPGALVTARVGPGRPALLLQVDNSYHLRTTRGCWQEITFVGPLIAGGLLGLDLLQAPPRASAAAQVTVGGVTVARHLVEGGVIEALRPAGTLRTLGAQLWNEQGLAAQWRFGRTPELRLPRPVPVCPLESPAVTG